MPPARTSRRRVLRSLAGGLPVALAGCQTVVGSCDPIDPPTVTPSAEHRRTPNYTACSDDGRLFDLPQQVLSSPAEGFRLEVSPETVAISDTLTATLQNTSNRERSIGNRNRFDFERETDTGWRSVFWAPEDIGWTVEAYGQPPCGGFAWAFTMSQSGLTRPADGHPDHHACEPLTPGTYRFVFWGLSDETAIAREFTLTAP